MYAATTEDDDIHTLNDEIDAEVSIGTDIPDHDIFNEDIQSAHELQNSYPDVQEDPSTSSPTTPNADNDDNHGKPQLDNFLHFSMFHSLVVSYNLFSLFCIRF